MHIKEYLNPSPLCKWSIFGAVLIACRGTATEKVVVKKLIASSRADEKLRFFKEARRNSEEFGSVVLTPPVLWPSFHILYIQLKIAEDVARG